MPAYPTVLEVVTIEQNPENDVTIAKKMVAADYSREMR